MQRYLTVKEQTVEIRAFVNLCLSVLDAESVLDIADATGLSVSTVYRLIAGKVSPCIHIGTIQRLGNAAGFRLELTKTTARMRVA